MRSRAVLLLSLALTACPSKQAPEAGPDAGPPGPVQVEEKEPNNTAATALVIKVPTRLMGALSGDRPDEDYLRLEGAPNQVASLEITGIPGADVALELLDRDGNHVALYNSEGEGDGERISNLGLAAPWLVRIHSAKKGSGGSYVATVTYGTVEAGSEVESNNRAVDASPLTLAQPIHGVIGDRADEDWFKFEVPLPVSAAPVPPGVTPADAGGPPAAALAIDASQPLPSDAAVSELDAATAASGTPATPLPPAVVKLELAGVPNVRLQVELANAAQAVFYTARSREAGEGIQLRNLALRPGETSYFVIVKSAWSGAGKEAKRSYNTANSYTLTITPEEAGANAELEPNDDPAHATPLVGDGTRQGFFAPKGDIDYFVIRAEKPTLVRVELTGVDRVDAILSVVRPQNADGTGKEEILLRANDGAIKEGELLLNVGAGKGDVFLKVEAAPRLVENKWVRDQENATEPYRLTLTSRPDDGTEEREPNNSADTATPLTLGKTVRGWIHPKKDVDLYRIDLSASPVKVPLKATATGILKVDVALALFRVQDKGEPALVQRADKGKGDQSETIRYSAEPGIYLLEVRDTKNLQSNFVDAYLLSVEQSAD